MNAEQFAFWMRGYIDAIGTGIPTDEQWLLIMRGLHASTDGSLSSYSPEIRHPIHDESPSRGGWVATANAASIAGFASL